MSKGNLLFGQGRGKIGDLVLTRVAGEQVARSRNRNPKNPRTTKQMVQRAAMATLVEFFKRGNRNLFKFAFESKKPGESDYNAFVRANINRVPVQSKKTLRENGFVGGEYIMTEGSLPQPLFKYSGEYEWGALSVAAQNIGPDAYTIGDLSKALIAVNGLMDGDIITLVCIEDGSANPINSLDGAIEAGQLVTLGSTSKWHIRQFTLDVNSTVLASTLDFLDISQYAAGDKEIFFTADFSGDNGYSDEAAIMLGVIASRVTPSGVLVSTSQLVCNSALEHSNTVGISDAWKIWVAKHFMETTAIDAPAEDILKGSLSEN